MNLCKRSVAVSLVLGFLTCGIYTLYLMYEVDRDVNTLSNADVNSGGTDVLLTIITCGLYGIYWYYKIGRQLDDLSYDLGLRTSNISILTLVLAIVGFGIISMAITQSELNRVIDGTVIH